MPNTKLNDNSEGLAGLLSAALTQVQIVQAADDETDNKANNLMAAALVVVTLLATQIKGQDGWHVMTIIAMLILLGVVLLVMHLTRERRYESAVVDVHQHPEYFSMDNEWLLAQLIEDAVLADTTNKTILKSKQKTLRYGVYIFLIGFALGVVALFINA